VEKTTRIGIVGCGSISHAYFRGIEAAPGLSVVACADLDPAAASQRAEEFGCRALGVTELFSENDIELVVNLTTPRAHAEIALAALQAGKHVYSEKPLAVSTGEALKVLELAKARGLRVGCAPDTFLGGGLQTCRKLFDEGRIGAPVGGVANLASPGPESWHPNPGFYYDIGGGPLFDMGPYYLTALVSLLGPARRVCASSKTTHPERVVTSQPRHGSRIPVRCPTHVSAIVDFDCGATVALLMSFDVQKHRLPTLELFGTDGTLALSNPNSFGGSVGLVTRGEREFRDIELCYPQNARAIGVVDMVSAIRRRRPHRADADLAYHVLEVMEACERSSETGRHLHVHSRCDRPQPLPMGLGPWETD
jgi:predicted dehydrogenase